MEQTLITKQDFLVVQVRQEVNLTLINLMVVVMMVM
jgi:hypothetical protein